MPVNGHEETFWGDRNAQKLDSFNYTLIKLTFKKVNNISSLNYQWTKFLFLIPRNKTWSKDFQRWYKKQSTLPPTLDCHLPHTEKRRPRAAFDQTDMSNWHLHPDWKVFIPLSSLPLTKERRARGPDNPHLGSSFLNNKVVNSFFARHSYFCHHHILTMVKACLVHP